MRGEYAGTGLLAKRYTGSMLLNERSPFEIILREPDQKAAPFTNHEERTTNNESRSGQMRLSKTGSIVNNRYC